MVRWGVQKYYTGTKLENSDQNVVLWGKAWKNVWQVYEIIHSTGLHPIITPYPKEKRYR